jgi:hypothetical protein
MSATWTATPQQMEKVLAAVLPHAAADGYLPAISCVRLEATADRLIAAATDRYTIGVAWGLYTDWHDDAEPVEPTEASIFASDIKRLLTFLKPHRKEPAVWALTDQGLSVDVKGESLTVRSVDVQFPKWRTFVGNRAAKQSDPAAAIRFTPKMVDHFTQTAKALGEETTGRMVWRLGTAIEPALVEFLGANFIGLIMPQRMEELPALDLSGIGIEGVPAVAA